MSHLLDELIMPGPDEDVEKPPIHRMAKLLKPMEPYIRAYFGKSFDWEQHHCRLPAKAFAGWTTDEKMRVCWSSCLCSDLKDEIEADVRYTHFDKLRLAFHHWGATDSYADFVRAYNGIRRFDFGIPGFEVKLDHSTGGNERGYANYHRSVFLDAEFGYMIYHNGEHVLTIGFSPSKQGVLIAQAQCAKKSGNRWLFRLGKPLLAHIVDRFAAAFPNEDIYLVDGKSLAAQIRKNYQRLEEEMEAQRRKYGKTLYKNVTLATEETYARIEKTYAVRIPGRRRGKIYRRREILFRRLTPINPNNKIILAA